MIRLLRVELAKVALRPRSYLGYLGILLLLVPYVIGFHYGRPEDFVRHRVGRDFEVVGTFFNALFLTRLVMEPLFAFFLPLFVSFVTGDLIAGEAAEGTLRALLVRPVSRRAVVAAKFAVGMLHAAAMTLFLGLTALGVGALFFGVGDLFVFESGIYVLPMGEALLRLLGAYAFGALGMAVVGSFAFALSAAVDHGLWAIGGAMMLLIVSGILGLIPYFENLRPYLFTTHMALWRQFFAVPIAWGEIANAALWLAGHVAVFFAAALAIFTRKDILS